MHKMTTLICTLLLLGSLLTTSTAVKYMHPQEAMQYIASYDNLINGNDTDYHRVTSILQQLMLQPEQVFYSVSKTMVSDKCADQLTYMLDSLADGEMWSLQMLDAFAKPEPGILTGRFNWFGDFDECTGIKSPWNSSFPLNNKFSGKYCTSGHDISTRLISLGVTPTLEFGVCFPDGCTSDEVNSMVEGALQHALNLTTVCQESDVPLSSTAIVTIVFYSLIGTLCFVASMYDYFTQHSETAEHDDASPLLTENSPLLTENGHQNIQENGDVSLISYGKKKKSAPIEHGAMGKFLLCFSFYTNGSKLLSAKKNPDSLGCLHGIRFFSMTWVILGHTLVFSFQSVGNFSVIATWLKRWSFDVVLNATVSVDSFFVMSGLLSVYLMVKQFERSQTSLKNFIISVPILYIHRWLRLTPAYGFMILFYASIPFYTYEGPMRPNSTITDPFCSNNSWAAIFYLNNIYESADMCAAWGWYLSNDYQFYLVTPFIAYIAYKNDILGYIVAGLLTLVSICTAMAVSLTDDIGVSMFGVRDKDHPGNPQGQLDYYFKPWTRFQSFGVGCIFALILWKFKPTIKKMPTVINLLLWALSGIIMLSYLYGPYEVDSTVRTATKFEAALYNGVGRTAWSVALGYVILACCSGRGGWVDEFLSWPGFIPLSRLTYCAYLMHPVIMITLTSAHKQLDTWTDFFFASQFASFTVLAYLIAFPFSLLFEAPFMNLDKNYLTGRLMKK